MNSVTVASQGCALPGRDSLEDDKLREECGVFGVFDHPDAAALTALGLHALQHRGQEACGIVTYDGDSSIPNAGLGRRRAFRQAPMLDRLPGRFAIGHTRYSTAGGTILRNVQPLFADFDVGRLCPWPQRQPDQLPSPCANSWSARRDLPIDLRHRGHPAPDRPLAETAHSSSASSRPCGRSRAAMPWWPDQQEADRRARSARHPAAGAGRPRRQACARFGDLRPGHHRRRLRPRHRARRDGRDLRRTASSAIVPSRRLGRGPASSNMSISPAPTGVDGRCVYDVRKRMGARSRRRRRSTADVVVPVPDFGRAGGDRLCAGVRPALRDGHHPQPLCRADLHPAGPAHRAARREAEAQPNRLRGGGKRMVLIDDTIVRGTTSMKSCA